MQSDINFDQLLARAILDLELKIKHEMRQNSALQLAKMDKHFQQMDKRIGIIEAKLEALISRDNHNSPRDTYSHLQPAAIINQYQQRGAHQALRTPPHRFINSRPQQQSSRMQMQQMDAQAPTQGHPYGVFGGSVDRDPAGITPSLRPRHQPHPQKPHTFQHNTDRKKPSYRPKQMLGTGGNKEKINTSKVPSWTTKIGQYTSDEDSDKDDNSTRSTELGYTIAKPSPASGEVGQNYDNEQESNADAEEEPVKSEDEQEKDDKDKDVIVVEEPKKSEDDVHSIGKEVSASQDVAKSGVPEVAKDGGPAEGAKSGGFGQGRRK